MTNYIKHQHLMATGLIANALHSQLKDLGLNEIEGWVG
jgi:hypothetical protein